MKQFLIILMMVLTFFTLTTMRPSKKINVPPSKVDTTPISEKNVSSGFEVNLETAKRVGLVVGLVSEEKGQKKAPLSAIWYDSQGVAFVFEQTEPNIFLKKNIHILSAKESWIYFSEGPSSKGSIAISGIASLISIENGVKKDEANSGSGEDTTNTSSAEEAKK